jgi:phage terminase large subunit-like protein
MKATPSVIEDKGSGTQLVQDLRADGVHGVARYEPKVDKVMRMHSVSSTIESGFVHIPDQAHWLPEFLHEMWSFPRGKYDDQVDSTSQALDWIKNGTLNNSWLRVGAREHAEKSRNAVSSTSKTTYLPGCVRAFPIR